MDVYTQKVVTHNTRAAHSLNYIQRELKCMCEREKERERERIFTRYTAFGQRFVLMVVDINHLLIYGQLISQLDNTSSLKFISE